MKMLTKEDIKNLVMGGCILGGGGGGSMELGLEFGYQAIETAEINLIDISELEDEDTVVCASMVGAPSAIESFVSKSDYEYSIKKMQKELNQEIKGIFTNENGGGSSINGFMQSALTGIPLVDAPANGRAHPTGIMGSLNLHKNSDYLSTQIYSGGNPDIGNNVRGVVSGNLNSCSKVIRNASVVAGGMVVVVRNPVNVSYLKNNGAVGAWSFAINLGKAYYEALDNKECPIEKVTNFLNGEIVTSGNVSKYELLSEGGFDIGNIYVEDCELTFWNEYMTLDKNKRIYTFPDLIMTFDNKTKLPITTAEIKEGMEITVIASNKDNIPLGSPMFDKELLKEVSEIIKKEI